MSTTTCDRRNEQSVYKNTYGNGSVYWSKHAQSWVAQYSKVIDGKQYRASSLASTQAEAVAKLNQVKAKALKKRKLDIPQIPRYSLRQEIDFLFDSIAGTVEHKTLIDYTYRANLFRESDIIDEQMAKLNRTSIQKTIVHMAEQRKLCVSTCRKLIMFIKRVFCFAKEEGHIKENPIEARNSVKMPVCASDENESLPLTREECHQLLNVVDRLPGFKPIIYCMLFAGLRINEVLALTWEKIDFENKEIHVKHAVKKVCDPAESKSTYVIGRTKSKRSVRTVPMSEMLRACLAEWKAVHSLHVKAHSGLSLLFPNSNGDVQYYDSFASAFRRALQQNALSPHRYHSRIFRHTFASYLVGAGIDPKTLQRILGHSNITTTLTYYVEADEVQKICAVEAMSKLVMQA